MYYNKCGIHSRLQNIINKSGGYNVQMAAELLMKEYGIDNKDTALEMARSHNIREKIKTLGLDTVIKIANKAIIDRRLKLAQFMSVANYFQSNFYSR